ncbi:MAG TPA: hypothetical protein VMH80_26805 [Bryobacteraceae bacterium]|nr:hypothetical protein [Bryobacteraceae bacterium]
MIIQTRRFLWLSLLASASIPQLAGQQSSGCGNSALNKTYAFTLNSRAVTNGTFGAVGQDIGTAVLDGNGNATINVTFNSNAQTNQAQSLQATYSLAANCAGTLTLPGGTVLNLTAWNNGNVFAVTGNANGAVVNGGGTASPTSCILATLTGPFAFNANAFVLTGTNVTGIADVTGLFQFDGIGNASATWSVANGTTATTVNAGGQYSMGSNCQGVATLNDSANMVSYVFNFSVVGGINNFNLIASSPSLLLSGGGHAVTVNAGQAVVNAASFQPNASSPATIFSIFGQNLAAGAVQASTLPLPDTLGTTSVTVNGENAPLYYAGPGQINAEIPTDIKPGLATVIVTNGGVQSNAVAVNVTGVSPGIFVYGNNRGVVVNQDGSVNAANAPAHVGDTLVAYFCGGGPVTPAAALMTGMAAPDSIAPITNNHSVTVGGVNAKVTYMGLTPEFVGLYQTNFVVPQVPTGDQPLAIFVNGRMSNAPVITIAE